MGESRKFKKQFDLEERTLIFAERVREFIKDLSRSAANMVYVSQLIRSSSSIGANYIEANESLSRKDFYHRIKICRKETKETRYWLRLIDISEGNFIKERDGLMQETFELAKIFGAILKTNISSRI